MRCEIEAAQGERTPNVVISNFLQYAGVELTVCTLGDLAYSDLL